MSAVWDGHIAAPFEMRGRQRTIAACDADAARSLAPWSQDREDTVLQAWKHGLRVDREAAAQEWRMVDALIEHLQSVREA